MCCHAQSLPEESERQQPVKSAEVFQRLGCNEAVEFREENTPYESRMDVEYLQKHNSSSKPKHTENKLEMDRRKVDVDRHDKIKTLSGVRDATPLEKVAPSFKKLAVHYRGEKTKLNLQPVSNPGVSGSVERDTNKLHKASLDKSYFIAENEILEKINLNPNEAKSIMQEILDVSSGSISESHYTVEVSESYPLDFEASPVQSDPSLGTELVGNTGDLNASIAPSEIISGGEDYFPLAKCGSAKKLLSHGEKVSEKKISQGKICGLDNINISGKKQSEEHRLEQGQKCKDLLLVAEMDSRDKGHNTKVPGKSTELQKIFCKKTGKKASHEKKEKQKKRDNDSEEKRNTTIIKVPEFLCNANETVNLRMILNQSKSTFQSQNMSRSGDLKLIEHNLSNEYANDTNYFAF